MTSRIYENIQRLAAERNMTLRELESVAGFGQNTIYRWKVSTPSGTSMKKIASALGVPVERLYERDNPVQSSPVGNMIQMPIVGSVRAGYDGLAVEDYLYEYKGIPAENLRGYAPNECRLLRVRGNSMYPTIVEGDTVLVHRQEDIESGEIAVVFGEDGEATIKTVIKGKNFLELVPKNPEYQTKRYDNGSSKVVHIWGKVLTLYRDF